MSPKLWYCSLDDDTDPEVAINIFINVNRSAIKLKQVDIAIAIARADHGEDLRARAENYLQQSTEARHYFKQHLSRAIPEVAAWILKVGCLKVRSERYPHGLPPKESHYPSAIRSLFGSNLEDPDGKRREREARMTQLEADLDTALRFVACRGGATKRTLPAWPPVHVIAALQDDVRMADEPLDKDVTKLLAAYLWRAFFTDRYQAQANDRLLEDYQKLREYIGNLVTGRKKPDVLVPAFDDDEHPLPRRAQLERAGWIGLGSRLGRAIAAIAMTGDPYDWLTDQKLTVDRVRELESKGQLYRHYIFPANSFRRTSRSQDQTRSQRHPTNKGAESGR